ncbi:MAG: terminase [Pseudomonadota bacterium]
MTRSPGKARLRKTPSGNPRPAGSQAKKPLAIEARGDATRVMATALPGGVPATSGRPAGKQSSASQAELVRQIAACSDDPLRFVRFAFPWGDKAIKGHAGPDRWQVEILTAVRDRLLTPGQAIQIAVASGHGVGKSALVAWLILWAVCTFEDTKGVVTANTETQLRTKTWAELGKWYRLLICRHWFRLNATSLVSTARGHEQTWRVDMVPWSEHNVEAFAGLHNVGKRVILLFDEASAIPDPIWETAQGALTDADTQILWFAFGNPTRNTGRFKACFGRYRHRWYHRQIDSRTVSLTNKRQIQQWIDDYGEDSDFVRIRVRGAFPRSGANQFIAQSLIEAAIEREVPLDPHAPVIIGVDVARFGDDQTVIATRQGRVLTALRKLRGRDTWEVAQFVAEIMARTEPDAVFVDGGGVGGGVVDNLRRSRKRVIEVSFGARALRRDEYANRRAEMWGEMRKWLKTGRIIDDNELLADLAGPEYSFVRENVIQLERKRDMKARGLSSPDCADALALTFAQPMHRWNDDEKGQSVYRAQTHFKVLS